VGQNLICIDYTPSGPEASTYGVCRRWPFVSHFPCVIWSCHRH